MVLSLTLLLGGAVALSASGEPVTREDGPNIVLIVADDLDTRLFARVPYFRRALTEKGTRFTRTYAADSLCCPSRATILRGQYVHNHRVLSNTPPEGGYSAFVNTGDEESTLATWLDGAGYHTAMFGKYLNGYPAVDDNDRVPPGWDEWYVADHAAIHQYHYWMVENGERRYYGGAANDFNTDVLARKAGSFIRGNAGAQPFFMYVAPFAPHMPATAAPRYADAFPKARAPRTSSFDQRDVSRSPGWVRANPRFSAKRLAMIDRMYRHRLLSTLAVRDMVRQIVTTLRQTGELDDTYLVFTSDNGYHLGQHRLRSGKRSPYEEDIRVPLVVRGPDVPAGRRVDALVSLADLAPTVADLARAPHPDFVDGRSLEPFLSGSRPPMWRDAVLTERHSLLRPLPHPDHHPTGRQPRRRKGVVAPPPFYAMRTQRYTYVEYITGEVELYDNVRDPPQRRNLAPTADRDLLRTLARRLHRLSTCAGAECRQADRRGG